MLEPSNSSLSGLATNIEVIRSPPNSGIIDLVDSNRFFQNDARVSAMPFHLFLKWQDISVSDYVSSGGFAIRDSDFCSDRIFELIPPVPLIQTRISNYFSKHATRRETPVGTFNRFRITNGEQFTRSEQNFQSFSCQTSETTSYQVLDTVKTNQKESLDSPHRLGKLFEDSLPRELQLYILGLLDMRSRFYCTRVCTHWREIALDGQLWSTLDLSVHHDTLCDRDIMTWTSTAGHFLNCLNLRGCLQSGSKVLRHIAIECPHLKELNISDCRSLTSRDLKSLTLDFRNLHKLNLSSIEGVNDPCLQQIVHHCPHLRKIDLSWCRAITSLSVRALLHQCRHLQELSLAGCHLIDDTVFEGATVFSHLRYLNLQNCDRLTDQGVQWLANHCPHLVHIILSDCPLLTDQSSFYISHSHLKNHVWDRHHEYIALDESAQELEILEFARCQLLTDEGFEIISKHCHNLRKLDLEECFQMTDLSLKHFANELSHLESIILSCCDNITDEGFEYLVNGCPHLRQIEIDGCPNLSDKTLESIQRLKRLQKLDVFDCQNISRNGLRKLKTVLSTLQIRGFDWPIVYEDFTKSKKPPSSKLCLIM